MAISSDNIVTSSFLPCADPALFIQYLVGICSDTAGGLFSLMYIQVAFISSSSMFDVVLWGTTDSIVVLYK